MRYPTTAARKSLAARFDLPYSDLMQDWEWEVADFERFGEFLDAYKLQSLMDDERFSLMEILVQCVEDALSHSGDDAAWLEIEPLLLLNASLHRATIDYWARAHCMESEGLFHVSVRMRRIWHAKFS